MSSAFLHTQFKLSEGCLCQSFGWLHVSKGDDESERKTWMNILIQENYSLRKKWGQDQT